MLLALLSVLWVQSAPGALFEVDLWPGEGRPVFAAAAVRIELREGPSMSARVIATWTGRIGHRLAFDDTLVRTVSSGHFIALGSATITGRQLGEVWRLSRADYYFGRYPAAQVEVKAGDVVEYLQYRAEGTCFLRVAGLAIDAGRCPTQRPESFRLVQNPETEWWIHVVDGNAKGWLLVTDASARVVRREG